MTSLFQIKQLNEIFNGFSANKSCATFSIHGKELCLQNPDNTKGLGCVIRLDFRDGDGLAFHYRKHIVRREQFSENIGLTYALWSSYHEKLLSYNKFEEKIEMPDKADETILELMEIKQLKTSPTYQQWITDIFRLNSTKDNVKETVKKRSAGPNAKRQKTVHV